MLPYLSYLEVTITLIMVEPFDRKAAIQTSYAFVQQLLLLTGAVLSLV